jgi:hypothetical protein
MSGHRFFAAPRGGNISLTRRPASEAVLGSATGDVPAARWRLSANVVLRVAMSACLRVNSSTYLHRCISTEYHVRIRVANGFDMSDLREADDILICIYMNTCPHVSTQTS